MISGGGSQAVIRGNCGSGKSKKFIYVHIHVTFLLSNLKVL